jgi:hypothetical protein
MSICLLQEPLEPVLVAPSIARRTIRRQKSGARVRGPTPPGMGVGLLLALGDIGAARVYFVDSPPDSDERCFALTRAETDVKCCPVPPGGQ